MSRNVGLGCVKGPCPLHPRQGRSPWTLWVGGAVTLVLAALSMPVLAQPMAPITATPLLPPSVQQPQAPSAMPPPADQAPAAPQEATPTAPQPMQQTWVPQGSVQLQVLDKVNAQNAMMTVKVGQDTQFGSLTYRGSGLRGSSARSAAGLRRLSDDYRQPCRRAGIPRLDAGERPVAVDAGAPGLRRACRRLQSVVHGDPATAEPGGPVARPRWNAAGYRAAAGCRSGAGGAAGGLAGVAATDGRCGCGHHRPACRAGRYAAR